MATLIFILLQRVATVGVAGAWERFKVTTLSAINQMANGQMAELWKHSNGRRKLATRFEKRRRGYERGLVKKRSWGRVNRWFARGVDRRRRKGLRGRGV